MVAYPAVGSPDWAPALRNYIDGVATEASTAPQSAEGVPRYVASVAPKTAGFAPFQMIANSFSNSGGGAGTKNHAFHLGWNAARHGDSAGAVTPNRPAVYMGFEDNYFDAGGDNTYGVEWYVGYISPNGTSVPVGALRPFYFRVLHSDDNTATNKSVIAHVDIGRGPDGSFSVWGGVQNGVQVAVINHDVAIFNVHQVSHASNLVTQGPASGEAIHNLNGKTYSQLNFQIDYASAYGIAASSVNVLSLIDKAGRGVATFTYGATAASAIATFSSIVNVEGNLAAAGNFQVSPPAGQAIALVKAPGGATTADKLATVQFQIGASAKFAFTADEYNELILFDNTGNRAHALFITGASDAAALTDLKSSLQVRGNVGFYGTTPIAKRATTANATDLATAITLVNALKADLQAYGLKA